MRVETGPTLTGAYLAYTERGPFVDAYHFVRDIWPTGDITLGVDAPESETVLAPVTAVAASVGALCTKAALGENASDLDHPNAGILTRSNYYHGLLYDLRHRFSMTQPASLHLATVMADWEFPHLRNRTMSNAEVRQQFRRSGVGGSRGELISANDHLAPNMPVESLAATARTAIASVIGNEYQLNSPNHLYFGAHMHWATLDRMGAARYHLTGDAADYHYGRFLYFCSAIRATNPDIPMARLLRGDVFATYQYAIMHYGGLSVSSSQQNGQVGPLPIRHRDFNGHIGNPRIPTPEEAAKLLRPPTLPVLVPARPTRPIEGQPGGRAGSELEPASLLRGAANIPEVTCGEAHRMVGEAARLAVERCVEAKKKIGDHASRVEEMQANVDNLFEEFPHLRPRTTAAIRANSAQFARWGPMPDRAVETLVNEASRRRVTGQGRRPASLAGVFAAATLGPRQTQLRALDALGSSIGALRAYVLNGLPAIQTPGPEDVPDREGRFGVSLDEINQLNEQTDELRREGRITPEEATDLRIQTAQFHDLPMDIYVPAAMALLDNRTSLFATRALPRNLGDRVAYFNMPPDRDMENLVNEIRSVVYAEASDYYGVPIEGSSDGDPTNGRSFWNTQSNEEAHRDAVGRLLVACRLAGAAEVALGPDEDARERVAVRLGPVLAEYNMGWVRRNMPRPVYDQYAGCMRRYHEVNRRAAAH